MNSHKQYMQRCIDLALKGIQHAAPNPMVGCVIVHNDKIIGEGYHEKCGEPHAEVNAINSVNNKELLKESTLYVNLEPCSHFGKTPPCADLIIKHSIPKVYIGCIDSFSEVSGKGIEKLRNSGCEVHLEVLEKESKNLNKRFFTFHEKKRPYVILKWAETQDGFIDIDRERIHCKENSNENSLINLDNWITTDESKKVVHQWRSEEQAIMIGTNTALNDNPRLNVREVKGENPIRVVLDLNLRLPQNLHVFDCSIATIVFNKHKSVKKENIEYIKVDDSQLIKNILEQLFKKNITSIIIEGGTQLLNAFIEQNLWDEARQFIGEKRFGNGLKSPTLKVAPIEKHKINTDTLNIFLNG